MIHNTTLALKTTGGGAGVGGAGAVQLQQWVQAGARWLPGGPTPRGPSETVAQPGGARLDANADLRKRVSELAGSAPSTL